MANMEENQSSPRGALILFEGLDCSGKSTQAKKLVEYLNSIDKKTVQFTFPIRSTAIGEIIDKFLKKEIELPDQAIHLLFSANRWEAVKTIQDLLEIGTNVVMDRYAYSGVAYSAAKGFDLEWCKSTDQGLLAPDLILFFNMDPSIAVSREHYGSERYEIQEFQQKVRAQFFTLIGNSSPSVWARFSFIECGTMGIEATFEKTKHKVEKFFESFDGYNEPLDQLW